MTESDALYSVKFSEIRAYLKTQDLLFWLINIYLFLEYVRPQSLYPVFDLLPYSKIICIFTLLVLLTKPTSVPRNISDSLLVLLSSIVLASSVFAMSPSTSFGKISDYIAWVVIYYLITRIVTNKDRFFVFILGFLVYNFKMSQFSFKNWVFHGFSFSDWGSGGGPGWFHNSGEFGIEMCIFLPISFYFFWSLKGYWPRWKKYVFFLFPLTALSGTVSSSSRGAVVGATAVILWIFLKSKHRVQGIFVLLLIAIIVWSFLPPEQKGRFETAGQDQTSRNRTIRWEKGLKMAERYPFLGAGYANWGVADRFCFDGDGSLSHNIFIECVSELGYTGLAAFVLLILSCFLNNYRTRKLVLKSGAGYNFHYWMAHGLDAALIGYITSGFFVTVMYYPYFWINLSLTVALNNIIKVDVLNNASNLTLLDDDICEINSFDVA